jgi:hypothetical protein
VDETRAWSCQEFEEIRFDGLDMSVNSTGMIVTPNISVSSEASQANAKARRASRTVLLGSPICAALRMLRQASI